ncbi:MAG: hypothetical protein AMS15_03025 [Planctomycetes bacterium DG_23]|nr:MAG: hypothetical protein AMS15_03025 [Planctomycetes bacterium DG_23]
MGRGITRIFGSQNERYLKELAAVVEEIKRQGRTFRTLSDEELRAKTDEFRKRIKENSREFEDILAALRDQMSEAISAKEKLRLRRKIREIEEKVLDPLIPEAFAVVKEACRRHIGKTWEVAGVETEWNMVPFDVQLGGAIALHRGMIAEMATGEGKTLVAVMPAYLNALLGQGVHIVTVNDYLARRDRDWMGPIYEFLGLGVGVIQSHMPKEEKQAAYRCDITYGQNNEFGFDYLRDNMEIDAASQVQRRLHYAILDEVDSILIDEARTPLIISGPAFESTQNYYRADQCVRPFKGIDQQTYDAKVQEMAASGIPERHAKEELESKHDFKYDQKRSSVSLTEKGTLRAQNSLNVEDFYSGENVDWPHFLEQALRAHHLFKRDQDYVVKGGQVVIVDEFTGRLMPGRVWSDGLHQAIEAKEHLKIKEENQTLATITFQNFFRLYEKIAGMTGTAKTEETELYKIYDLEVLQVPTNKPLIRYPYADAVYRTEEEKFAAIIDEILEVHKSGRPILVGTRSIEKSERLSKMLKQEGIEHEVLNAKHHQREAQIVAKAGEPGRVTIATNMAGRGTDIVLGPGVAKEGGLHIVGTERHEARRIDNQLAGRSGRQGDPGSSRFFLSFEDEIMRLFIPEWIGTFMQRHTIPEGEAIEHSMVTKAISRAQKKVEERNFEIRKDLLEFDEVMDQQRKIIYSQRQKVLLGEDLKDMILDMIDERIVDGVETFIAGQREEWDFAGLIAWARKKFGLEIIEADLAGKSREEIEEFLYDKVLARYTQKEKDLGEEAMRHLEKFLLLRSIDSKWKDHLYRMDQLRSGIYLRSYAQVEPIIAYKQEGSRSFGETLDSVQEEVTDLIFKVSAEERAEESLAGLWRVERLIHREFAGISRQQQAALAASEAAAEERPQPFVRKKPKVGRNAPCPCGSGKKYKHCCWDKDHAGIGA